MKKLIALIFVIVLLPITALADLNLASLLDFSSMSDEALKNLINLCSAELRSRAVIDDKGILLFEYEGIALYQTGDAYINENGLIIIPAYIENNLDDPAYISGDSIICNGWDIMANFGGSVQAHTKNNVDMIFLSGDAGLKSLDDIYSLTFKWTVTSWKTHKTLYQDEVSEEHRFW